MSVVSLFPWQLLGTAASLAQAQERLTAVTAALADRGEGERVLAAEAERMVGEIRRLESRGQERGRQLREQEERLGAEREGYSRSVRGLEDEMRVMERQRDELLDKGVRERDAALVEIEGLRCVLAVYLLGCLLGGTRPLGCLVLELLGLAARIM